MLQYIYWLVFSKYKTKDNKISAGFDASGSVIEIGYAGRIIDVNVSGLTGGLTYLLKGKQFKLGCYGG